MVKLITEEEPQGVRRLKCVHKHPPLPPILSLTVKGRVLQMQRYTTQTQGTGLNFRKPAIGNLNLPPLLFLLGLTFNKAFSILSVLINTQCSRRLNWPRMTQLESTLQVRTLTPKHHLFSSLRPSHIFLPCPSPRFLPVTMSMHMSQQTAVLTTTLGPLHTAAPQAYLGHRVLPECFTLPAQAPAPVKLQAQTQLQKPQLEKSKETYSLEEVPSPTELCKQ